MAVVNVLAAGLWSAPGTWTGGVPPGVGDDVYANGKAVTIDQNITVNSLNTGVNGGLTGGTFTLNTTRVINAVTINPGSSVVVLCATTAGTYTINANISSSATAAAHGVNVTATNSTVTVTGTVAGPSTNVAANGLNVSGAGTIANVNGNVLAGAGATANAAIIVSSTSILNLTGSVIGSSSLGLSLANTGQTTITGDVTGSNGQPAINVGAGSNIIINGNVSGGASGVTAVSAIAFANVSPTTFVINGNLTGGAGSNHSGISVTGSTNPLITINGNVTGGGPASPAIDFSTTGAAQAVVSGSVNASASSPAVTTAATAVSAKLTARGPLVSSGDVFPFAINHFQLTTATAATNYADVYNGTNQTRLSSPDAITNSPATNNVRAGVVYAGSSVGTLAVPSPSSVAVGVATDNTVGTAVLHPQDVWNYATASANTAGSMGERLKSAATVETTGDQISAAS